MRIAICVWGLLRSLRFTIDSFQQHILSALDRYEVEYDIYVHTYNISVYQSTRNHEKSVSLNVSEWQLLQPNYVFIEDQGEFDMRINYQLFETQGDPWHNDFSSFKNHMRALNSLYHLTQVVEKMHAIQPYDGVVFLRPDVRFLTDLPVQVLHNLPIMKEYDLFLPDFHRSCRGQEYNDRMAIGTVAAALTYGKKFETAFEYSLRHKLHAEKITYYQLTRSPQTLRVAEVPFRFQRIRSSGEVHIRDYEAVTPTTQAKLEDRGELFVGKGRRTPWIVRGLYTLFEYLTFGQMYVWNHDDHGNVFCHPHTHIDENTLQKMDKQYWASHKLAGNNGGRRKPNAQRIDCTYDVVPYAFTRDYSPISAKYIRVQSCRFVPSSEGMTGASALVKEIITEGPYLHMPKKVYHSIKPGHGGGGNHSRHYNGGAGGGQSGNRKYHLRSGMGHFHQEDA